MVSIAERLQKQPKNLKKNGMRPVQIWIPGTRSIGFAEECARQPALIKPPPHERDVLDFVENIADFSGWES